MTTPPSRPPERSRQEAIIGMRNCLEFLLEEARALNLTLPVWLLRMVIAALDEELGPQSPGRAAGAPPAKPRPEQ